MISPSDAPGLSRADFSPLPSAPFNSAIRISQAAAWFDGRLYIGGGRGPLGGAGGQPEGESTRELGAEIATYDPLRNDWRIVYRSPVLDHGTARDRSVRAFTVFQGKQDPEPALYAAAGSLEGQVVLLRSSDGERFEQCGAPGLGQGDADIAAVRSLQPWGGRLYTSPVGKNRGRGWADDNVAELPVVLACDDPSLGSWRAVSQPHFGDRDNESINELILFNDALYAGTLNRASGFQLWKGAAVEDGELLVWKKILDHGARRGPASPVPTAMQAFNGGLYIGTGVQRQGRGGADRFGPIAPELIRVECDDSWSLVAGETRLTPDGFRTPLSGQGAGFDDPFVQAFWRMTEHDGWLYLGAMDWRFWPSYLPRGNHQRGDVSDEVLEWLSERTRSWNGDYGLWRSRDGVRFEPVCRDGLGDNPQNYGVRGLVSTPDGLFAIPAARMGSDSGGGVEVWLGRPAGGER